MAISTKQIVWGSVITLLVGAGVGGGLYLKKQMDKAMNYCYKIVSLSNFQVTKDRLKVTLGVKFLNRSDIGANIQSYALDIYLNDIRLGKVSSDIKQRIEPNASSVLSVVADISSVGKITATDVITISLNYLNKANWNKITFRIKGSLKASIKLFGMDVVIPIPIDLKMSLKEIMTDDPSTASMECPKNF